MIISLENFQRMSCNYNCWEILSVKEFMHYVIMAVLSLQTVISVSYNKVIFNSLIQVKMCCLLERLHLKFLWLSAFLSKKSFLCIPICWSLYLTFSPFSALSCLGSRLLELLYFMLKVLISNITCIIKKLFCK